MVQHGNTQIYIFNSVENFFHLHENLGLENWWPSTTVDQTGNFGKCVTSLRWLEIKFQRVVYLKKLIKSNLHLLNTTAFSFLIFYYHISTVIGFQFSGVAAQEQCVCIGFVSSLCAVIFLVLSTFLLMSVFNCWCVVIIQASCHVLFVAHSVFRVSSTIDSGRSHTLQANDELDKRHWLQCIDEALSREVIPFAEVHRHSSTACSTDTLSAEFQSPGACSCSRDEHSAAVPAENVGSRSDDALENVPSIVTPFTSCLLQVSKHVCEEL